MFQVFAICFFRLFWRKRTLYVLRGLPGTGKSTRARLLTRHFCEADQYPGRYLPDGSLNPEIPHDEAHQWCFAQIEKLMQQNVLYIAVANTLVRCAYVNEWLNLAHRYGYQVRVIDCVHEYGSIHRVPAEVMNKMRLNWEDWQD